MVASNMSGHIQKQLTRSLERILEEAHLSGELKLSGRKLKDFPKVGKTGSSKYNLQDTVFAGESLGFAPDKFSLLNGRVERGEDRSGTGRIRTQRLNMHSNMPQAGY